MGAAAKRTLHQTDGVVLREAITVNLIVIERW